MDDLFDDDTEHYTTTEDGSLFNSYENEITQEDAWIVIDKYFEEKGLVRQQIDSFDDFISNAIPELIEDTGEIIVAPQNQYITGDELEQVCTCPFAWYSSSTNSTIVGFIRHFHLQFTFSILLHIVTACVSCN